MHPELRTKLDARAIPHVFLGLDAKSRCYRLGVLYSLAVSIAVEVTFVEDVFPFRYCNAKSPNMVLWGSESVARDEEKYSYYGPNLVPEAEAVANDLAKQLKIAGDLSTTSGEQQ